jgi:hypothetical protein
MAKKPTNNNARRRDVLGLVRMDLWLPSETSERINRIMEAIVADSRSDTVRYAIDYLYEQLGSDVRQKKRLLTPVRVRNAVVFIYR